MVVKSIFRFSSFFKPVLVVALIAGTVLGQQPKSPRVSTPPRQDTEPGRTANLGPSVIMSADEDYRLAASDVIEIIIEDAPELSGNYRVNKSGTIPMKYLGTMKVIDMTSEEISTQVAEGLRGRYLKDPKVYVTVKQYNSRNFFIQGSIRSPGVYVIEGRPSLFKLISIAGGLTENHGSTAYIIRETKVDPVKLEKARAGQADKTDKQAVPTEIARAVEEVKGDGTVIEGEAEYELITAHISGLFRGRFEQNLIIQPNDLVYVPPSDVFFVAGEVRAPGQFPLRDGTTLRQAISLAQGTYFKSDTKHGIIFRQDPLSGKLNEVRVDIGAVMSGKAQDMLIMPNDVIMVPNSAVKSVSGALMSALATGLMWRIPIGR